MFRLGLNDIEKIYIHNYFDFKFYTMILIEKHLNIYGGIFEGISTKQRCFLKSV